MKEKFQSELESLDNLDVFPLDMKSLESVQGFAKTVAQKYPRVHVLINNAGK